MALDPVTSSFHCLSRAGSLPSTRHGGSSCFPLERLEFWLKNRPTTRTYRSSYSSRAIVPYRAKVDFFFHVARLATGNPNLPVFKTANNCRRYSVFITLQDWRSACIHICMARATSSRSFLRFERGTAHRRLRNLFRTGIHRCRGRETGESWTWKIYWRKALACVPRCTSSLDYPRSKKKKRKRNMGVAFRYLSIEAR